MQTTEPEGTQDRHIVVLLYWDTRYNKPIAFDDKCGPWTLQWSDQRIKELHFLRNVQVTANEKDLLFKE